MGMVERGLHPFWAIASKHTVSFGQSGLCVFLRLSVNGRSSVELEPSPVSWLGKRSKGPDR